MTFKLKRFTFFLTGTLTLILELYLSYLLFHFIYTSSEIWAIKWLLSIVSAVFVFAIQFIGVMALTNIGQARDDVGFGEMLFYMGQSKKVYHSELGYFIIYIDNNVTLFEQKAFQLKYIKAFGLDEPESTSKNIKSTLDKQYHSKIANDKVEAERKEKAKSLIKWDGYLDTQGKRDSKLDKLGIN